MSKVGVCHGGVKGSSSQAAPENLSAMAVEELLFLVVERDHFPCSGGGEPQAYLGSWNRPGQAKAIVAKIGLHGV